MDLKNWLKSGEYLPKFMRDFHDQKRIFKRIDELVANRRERCIKEHGRDLYPLPGWVTCHIYVIDVFLWYMAINGYALQKTHRKIVTDDIEKDLNDWEKRDREDLYKNHPFYQDTLKQEIPNA